MNQLRRSIGVSRGLDIPAYVSFFALIIIGWLSLYAAGFEGKGFSESLSLSTELGRQTIWLGLSLICFFAVLAIDWKFWSSFAYFIYAFGILLLVGVLIFGVEIKGAQSWFNIGGFSFQPSEFAKFSTCLAVASLLGSNQISIKNQKHLLLLFGVIGLPSVLILLQPDAGSAIIFSSFLLLFYRAGANATFYFLGAAFVANVILVLMFGIKPLVLMIMLISVAYMVLSVRYDWKSLANVLLIFLGAFVFNRFGYTNYVFLVLALMMLVLFVYLFRENKQRVLALTIGSSFISMIISFGTHWAFLNLLRPHQQDRINVWLRPDLCDPRGSLYNIIQSKTAIGSGGFLGSGFLQGTMTKLDFVPEQSTDFIFCTIGEEQGFLGVVSVIVLFTILLSRIILMAERTRLDFIRYYMYAVAGILFLHVFINIGMTLGVMPIIGIPLPLMSKGGTSLLLFCVMIGIIFKMDLVRNRR